MSVVCVTLSVRVCVRVRAPMSGACICSFVHTCIVSVLQECEQSESIKWMERAAAAGSLNGAFELWEMKQEIVSQCLCFL